MDYHVQRLLDTYKVGDENFSKTAYMPFFRWLAGSSGKTIDAVSNTVKSLDTLSNRPVTRRNLLLRSGGSLAGKGLAATTKAVERTAPILARGGLYGTTSKGLLNNTPAQISRRDFFNRMKEVAAVNAPLVAPALVASSASRRANLLDVANLTQAGKAIDSASAGIQGSISGYVPAIRDATNLGKVISQVSPNVHNPLAVAKTLVKSPEARALAKDRPGTLIAPLLDEAGFLSTIGAVKSASLKDQTMNPHLKLAYDTGVQKALEDAGLTKEAFSPVDAYKVMQLARARAPQVLTHVPTHIGAHATPSLSQFGRMSRTLQARAGYNAPVITDAQILAGLPPKRIPKGLDTPEGRAGWMKRRQLSISDRKRTSKDPYVYLPETPMLYSRSSPEQIAAYKALSPQAKRHGNSIVAGHELDELYSIARHPGHTSFKGFGHQSPEVILKEHNRLVTSPKGVREELTPILSGWRAGKEADVLRRLGIEYGQGARLSRHARKRITEILERSTP